MGIMAANHKEVREPTAEGYPPAIPAGCKDARLLLHKVRAAGDVPDDPEEGDYDAHLAEIRGEPAFVSGDRTPMGSQLRLEEREVSAGLDTTHLKSHSL
jgi:hypothetical protein